MKTILLDDSTYRRVSCSGSARLTIAPRTLEAGETVIVQNETSGESVFAGVVNTAMINLDLAPRTMVVLTINHDTVNRSETGGSNVQYL